VKGWQTWLAVVVAYAVGACVFTWPLPANLGTHVWGDRFDAWTTLWLIWHLWDALATGSLTEVTDQILFPLGYNLWSFGHLGIQVLGIPLLAVGVSLTATYNALLLASFTATGVAAHALGRKLGDSHWAGALAGTVFAFNPYLYGEMSAGCLELVAAFLLPVYALTLVRLCERPSWQRALVTAGVLACVGPLNWYYTAFAALFTVGFWAVRALTPGERRPKALMWIVAAALLAAAVDVPLIHKARRETPQRTEISAETFSVENWAVSSAITNGQVPLDQVTPELLELNDAMQVAVNSTNLGDALRADFPTNPLESTPGRLAWCLGLVGWVAAGRRGRGWGALALGFTLLTLGPFVQVDATPPLPGWSLASPLPYLGLYNEVPFFSKVYRPYRLGVIVLMCLGALAAVGWTRLKHPAWRALPVGAWLIAVTQPHWSGASDRPMMDAAIPAIYEQLAELPRGGVIELPLQYQPVTPANARFQYFQVAHGQPLLNCNQLIRRTDLMRFSELVQDNGFLHVALDLGRQEPPYTLQGADLDALYELGFRYVIAHEGVPQEAAHLGGFHAESDRLRQPAWDMLGQTFGEPVLSGDQGTRVFALSERAGFTERTWTQDRQTVALPWTQLDLPLRLLPGQPLDLVDQGSTMDLWALRPEQDPGTGQLQWGDRVVDLPPGQWTRLSGPVAPLVAVDGPVVLRVDAVQVRP
jgi:hypothetical protein